MIVVNEASRLSQTRGARLSFGALAFALLTAVTYPIARYRMFTGFMDYDDEGYMLMFLKSFLDHGWHYEAINGYGIFYYEFWGAIFSVFGLPVDNNAGRTVVMVAWILSSLVIGVATWRMTRSIILGLATQLSVFTALFSLIPEPTHPGSLIVLLLVSIAALSCFVRDRTSQLPIALLGGAAMALIFVKINVGIFALTAVVLVCAVSYPVLAERRWLRPVFEIGFVVLPLALMRSSLDEAVVRDYALHVSAAALAVVIALRVRTTGNRDTAELWWIGGGVVAVGVTVPLVVLATGTDTSELIEGTITLPLSFGNAILRLDGLPAASHLLDLLVLAAAFGYWYLARTRKAHPNLAWTWFAAVASITVGLFLAFPMIWSMTLSADYAGQQLPLIIRWNMLCFAWVALIQPPGRPDRDTEFARLLLPPLAVLQALHSFPSAGSQMWWSTFLLVPVGAVCIANGVRWIAFGLGRQQAPRAPLAIRAIAPAMAIAVLVSNIGVQLKHELDSVRTAYDSRVTLGLPGAEQVHVLPQHAANLRAVVTAINKNCKAFVSLPGLPSFYIWTRQEPPTGYPPTKIPLLLGVERQQQMVEAIRSVDGLCLLNYPGRTRWWSKISAPPSPVVRYLRQGFVPIGEFGPYQLLKHKG